MHLTLIISSLSSGGAERVLTNLANYWVSKGNQVTLVTLASPNKKPFYPLDSKITLIQLNQNQNETSIFTRLKNICRRIFYLRKTLKTLNPDVVLSFVDVMNLTTILSSFGLKIPVVVSERTDPHFYHIASLYTKIRPFLYRFAKKIVVQTNRAASYFGKNLQRIIQIIPNPVQAPKYSKIFSPTAQSIITVGRLDQEKDQATLIQAFARLHSSYPHLTLTIYGEGPERENLQHLINSLNLQEKVSLPGVTQEIHQKLAEADLFVFPSLYEGFPNALAEAMSVGLPVIASNCSGNIDIVRDEIDGRLFPVGDVLKLAAIMEELLNDSGTRKRLSEEAKTVAERFHPDLIFHKWDQVIHEATGQII
ncbi:MAG: glycosyltransferase family 4 protein [Gammaproteobacteria bacterium]